MVQNPLSASNQVQVGVGADTSNYVSELDTAMATTGGFKSKLTTLSAVLAGGAAVAGLGVAGAMVKATQSAAEFESSLADVAKVTSEATAEQVKGDIKDLAEEIPVARGELTKLAEQAGKFGVEGEENIAQFTETTGKMSTAMESVPASEIGKRMAKIAQATGTPISRIDELGNATNELADTLNTNADELTDTATRAGIALSDRLGASRGQVLALSAAMNEVSPSSRRAAGSLRKMTSALSDPKKTEEFASALGMTPEAFREMRDEEPVQLMKDVATALTASGGQSEELADTLGKRGVESFSRFANSIGSVEQGLDTAQNQFENMTSLQNELKKRTDTLKGQMRLFKSTVNNLTETIGQGLLPVVKDAVSSFRSFTERAQKFAEQTNLQNRIREISNSVEGLFSGLDADGFSRFREIASDDLNAMVGVVEEIGDGDWDDAFGALEDRAVTRIEDIKEAAVGSSGSGGIINNMLDRAGRILSTKSAGVIKRGWRAFERVAMAQLRATADAAPGVIKNLLSEIGRFLRNDGKRIIRFGFKQLGETVRAVFVDLKRGIIDGEDSVTKRMIDAIAGYLKNDAKEDLWLAAKTLVGVIKAAVVGLFKGLIGNSLIPEKINEIADYFRNGAKELLKSAASEMFGGVVESVQDKLDAIEDKAESTVSKVKDKLSDVGETDDDDGGEPPGGLPEDGDDGGDDDDEGAGSGGDGGLGGGESEDTGSTSPSAGEDDGSDDGGSDFGPGDVGPGLPAPGVGDVPTLNSGGLIERTGAIIAHEGERMVPEAQVSDRGRVTAQVAMDEVVEQLERLERGGFGMSMDEVVTRLERIERTIRNNSGGDVILDGDRVGEATDRLVSERARWEVTE